MAEPKAKRLKVIDDAERARQWSTYADLVTPSSDGAREYLAAPYATVSKRGFVFERVVAEFLRRRGHAVEGCPLDEQRRYDLLLDGVQRVEVKSAQVCMRRTTYSEQWTWRLANCKWDVFDRLFLIMYVPTGLYIYEYDDALAKTAMLNRTTQGWLHSYVGHALQISAPNRVSFADAVADIQARLSPMLAGVVAFDDPAYDAVWRVDRPTSIDVAYEHTPLAHHTSQKCGIVLENVARRFVELSRGVKTSDPPSRDFDWWEGNLRVEAKSARIVLHKASCSDNHYSLTFQKLRRAHFDRLILVLFAPEGLHIYEHDAETFVYPCGRYKHVRLTARADGVDGALESFRARLAPFALCFIPFPSVDEPRVPRGALPCA